MIQLPDSLQELQAGAFQECYSLEEITFPEAITEIPNELFWGCKSLKNVTAQGTITRIGAGAFCENDAITKLNLPEGISYIGKYAFSNCKNLKEATLPEGLLVIGNGAFSNCEKLEDLNLPQGLETIGRGAFMECAFSDVTLPKQLKRIGEGAFWGSALKSVVIPEGITEIKPYTFTETPINTIIFPSSLQKIGSHAFGNCKELSNVAIPAITTFEGNPFCGSLWKTQQPGDFIIINNELLRYKGESSVVSIPQGVTRIGDGAFYDDDLNKIVKIQEINIPNSVKEIGNEAFYGQNLSEVTIPNSVVTIGDGAFRGCKKLEHIIIPSSVLYIGIDAFEFTPFLTNAGECAIVGDGILIYYEADKYEPVTIPATVKRICGEALPKNIKSVFIPETVVYIDPVEVGYCWGIEVDPRNPIYSSQEGALYNKDKTELLCWPCELEQTFFIPNKQVPSILRTIGPNACIAANSYLNRFVIPDGVEKISSDAFALFDKTVQVPDSVKYIAEDAFHDDTLLTGSVGSVAQQYADRHQSNPFYIPREEYRLRLLEPISDQDYQPSTKGTLSNATEFQITVECVHTRYAMEGSVVIALAFYDGNGRLLQTKCESNHYILAGGYGCSYFVDVPPNAASLKLFVWNAKTMEPMMVWEEI